MPFCLLHNEFDKNANSACKRQGNLVISSWFGDLEFAFFVRWLRLTHFLFFGGELWSNAVLNVEKRYRQTLLLVRIVGICLPIPAILVWNIRSWTNLETLIARRLTVLVPHTFTTIRRILNSWKNYVEKLRTTNNLKQKNRQAVACRFFIIISSRYPARICACVRERGSS